MNRRKMMGMLAASPAAMPAIAEAAADYAGYATTAAGYAAKTTYSEGPFKAESDQTPAQFWAQRKADLERKLRGDRDPWRDKQDALNQLRGNHDVTHTHYSSLRSVSPSARRRMIMDAMTRRHDAAQRQEWTWELEEAISFLGKGLFS